MAWAREALGECEAEAVLVRSTGLEAVNGRDMHPLSAKALIQLGGDPAGFRSTPFAPLLAETSDLVLTMTRGQRRFSTGPPCQRLSRRPLTPFPRFGRPTR